MLGLVLAGMLLASGAAAQTPPAQDSVVLTGGPATAGAFTIFELDARSGPSGEDPTGQVSYAAFGQIAVTGSVTCLAVSGDTATINIRIPLPGRPPPFDFGIVTVQVVDDQPDIFDATLVGRAPTDCSPALPVIFGGPVSGGDITVVDALPLPASKEQCKNGGWRSFGAAFKNQGQCLAFVERGPKP